MQSYIRATNFDQAWLNFEGNTPLEPLVGGKPNPFYVQRPGEDVDRLLETLAQPFYEPPKQFYSGHRGCGKSTEMARIAVNPEIRARYYPVHFSIRKVADVNNIDFKDVLLAIGGALIRSFVSTGRKLPPSLQRDLDGWRGTWQEELIHGARFQGIEAEGGLEALFFQAGLKLKLEPETRRTIRQIIERDITGLISLIDEITDAIQEQENRTPLLLIDDLDKVPLASAKEIFYNNRETMLQPRCAIVYTVTSSLFYSPEFEAIRGQAIFLPNIRLNIRGTNRIDRAGFKTMREFVDKRMSLDLIVPNALNHAIQISGGVFREMTRVMRFAIWHGRKYEKIQMKDVRHAEAEIRGEFMRMLTAEQRQILKHVARHNQYDEPAKLAPLLQNLAVLEYFNHEPWVDVHPALLRLVSGSTEDAAFKDEAEIQAELQANESDG